ncbi:oleosin-B6-like [Magnolia sinica]|uniref:oleosin-B6-like n=1 Tax=Magnolia sinica TaxID=86752 RepID=UPI002658F25F|nr:oleosin-B6-like [Magnolia sinica]
MAKGRKSALTTITATADMPAEQSADQGDPPSQLQANPAPAGRAQRPSNRKAAEKPAVYSTYSLLLFSPSRAQQQQPSLFPRLLHVSPGLLGLARSFRLLIQDCRPGVLPGIGCEDTPLYAARRGSSTKMHGRDAHGRGTRGRADRGHGARGRGTLVTPPTQAHPAPLVEDLIPEVPIRPAPPVEPVAPIPSVTPVPPPLPPPLSVVPVSESPAPPAAPVPLPEASAAPAFPTVPIGAEHFQQLMQLIATAL